MTEPEAPRQSARQLSRARHAARRLAVQSLYQWQLTGDHPKDILAQFKEERPLGDADMDYFRELLLGVPEHLQAIDAAIAPYLDRPLDRVDPVERAILRLAGYEMMQRLDVPYRVVINEAVDLAKVFGAEQGHRFINGVLDKAVRQLRAVETGGIR
ncbi:N utilization substance protein B [Acidihalobacter yilgarnensis]|uniref:Transcription antitermination protein NusB n=1 Tax=Acidihalobacter yilgarnensis TaxID=2819280 RepID=A0A1D8ILK2_9GAMM|nr:transcription antitermination factor NusB [Acidihalobacter yilgarnensis]AOU97301.1 N utilization substance protein B [Acidihalobacter yilgarnensis]